MQIIEIKVLLKDIEPPVARTLQVPADIRLDRLHDTLQAAMGWLNCHLYMFEAKGMAWKVSTPEFDDFGMEHEPADGTTLIEAVERTGARRILYTYDFGDGWEHDLQIGEARDAESDEIYPILTDVAGNCPPEDIGGWAGYEEFVEAMADSSHPEHEHYKKHYGGDFDPDAPDANRLRSNVRELAQGWKPKQ